MEQAFEGEKRESRERGEGKESMASGGGSPEEVFTRPWDPFTEGTDPVDLEGRDEEILPLIDTGLETTGTMRTLTLLSKVPGMNLVITHFCKICGHPRLTRRPREAK